MAIDLPAVAEAASFARDAVRRLMNGDGDRSIDDALLLTSELVTNAVLHTSGGCTLAASFDPELGALRIEVSDASGVVPRMDRPDLPHVIGGHGLHFVDRVAQRWGVTPTASGKTVWFELRA